MQHSTYMQEQWQRALDPHRKSVEAQHRKNEGFNIDKERRQKIFCQQIWFAEPYGLSIGPTRLGLTCQRFEE